MIIDKIARKITSKHVESTSRTAYHGTVYRIRTVVWRHWGGLAWSYTIERPNLSNPLAPRIVDASRIHLSYYQAKHEAVIEVGAIMDDIYATMSAIYDGHPQYTHSLNDRGR